MEKRKLERRQITYLRENVEIDHNNRRLYHGQIVRVDEEKLQRAYGILTTITGQHLNLKIVSRGVSHLFRYPGGVSAYVYGPESIKDIKHIKLHYDAALPLLQLLQALDLPVPG